MKAKFGWVYQLHGSYADYSIYFPNSFRTTINISPKWGPKIRKTSFDDRTESWITGEKEQGFRKNNETHRCLSTYSSKEFKFLRWKAMTSSYIHPSSHLKMEHGSQGYSSSLSILQPSYPSYPSTFQLTVFQHLKLEFHGISLTPATSPAARFKVYVVVSSRKKTTGIANRKSNNCQFAKEIIWTTPPLLGSMLIFQGVPHSSLSKNWNNNPLVYMAAIHLVDWFTCTIHSTPHWTKNVALSIALYP